jgi:hypothetical protein
MRGTSGQEAMDRHEAEVSRQETETARQEGERWRRQLDNQPAHERQTGGEESANKKQRRSGVSRGQEAAARREASPQPAGKREANGRGGASRQEATVSRRPVVPRDDERQRLRCEMTSSAL